MFKKSAGALGSPWGTLGGPQLFSVISENKRSLHRMIVSSKFPELLTTTTTNTTTTTTTTTTATTTTTSTLNTTATTTTTTTTATTATNS